MSSGRPAPVDAYVPGHGDERYGVDRYDLSLTYRPESNRLDGEATLDLTLRTDCTELAFDLAGLAVKKVRVDGHRAAKYTQHRAKRKVLVGLPGRGRAGDSVQVVITYSGTPGPIRSTWGDVGWEELQAGALVAGQPNGAPSWFPCNDRPSDKATYRISVTTDSPFTALANGVLAERRTGASSTTWVYEQDAPMATYLATVQIGQYEVRKLHTSAVEQRVARSTRLAGAVARDLARQDEMMACFIGLFGEYPFPAYTVVVTDDPLEIPLEAQAMSIFGSNHLAGRGEHERLVAHELAHQWFGNSLTVARWSDIWLNEGFACYAEWLWSECSGAADADTHAEREWLRLRRRPKDLLLADPGPADMFDDRVYKRGALTLHALRSLLGDESFFAMLRTWVADHRHGSVTTGDFVELATATGGEPAAELLNGWLFERSLPGRPAGRPRPRS